MEPSEDLRIAFASGPAGSEVRLRAGIGLGSCTFPLREDRLRKAFAEVLIPSPEYLKSLAPESLRGLGSILFEQLLGASPGRPLFDRAVERYRLGGAPVRLRFEFDPEDSGTRWLQNLPWEMCYSTTQRAYLAQNRGFSIVRSLRSPLPSSSLHLQRSPRCLIASADPKPSRLRSPLDLETETRAIAREFDEVGMGYDTLSRATLPLLRERLIDGQYGILHIAGHGYRTSQSDGSLRFGLTLEDPLGEEDPVDSEVLGAWIADSGVRLVVLNTCWSSGESARRSPGTFHGVAQRLIRLGIPAVLAMQFPICDSAATAFSQIFYRRVLRGDAIETALTESRKTIHRSPSWGNQWLVPSLFLHSPGSALFETRQEHDEAPPPEQRAPSRTVLRVQDIDGEGHRVHALDLEASDPRQLGVAEEAVEVDVGNLSGTNHAVIGKKIRFGKPPANGER